jgi:hypothetical protein
MSATQASITIDEIRREYPNTIPAEIIGRFLNKDAQRVRRMAKDGRFPFATVEVGRRRSYYIFTTERFIAWVEGRL